LGASAAARQKRLNPKENNKVTPSAAVFRNVRSHLPGRRRVRQERNDIML
jgi:hypothetical protein